MYPLYNNHVNNSINFDDFFNVIDYNIPKPQLKILSPIISAMARCESVVTSDISLALDSDIFFLLMMNLIKEELEDFLIVNNLIYMILSCFYKIYY